MKLQDKINANVWDSFSDFATVLGRALRPYGDGERWAWSRNADCKYVELRVDMRDGGCIIRDRSGRRITPERLAWQYSEETPDPPDGTDDEARDDAGLRGQIDAHERRIEELESQLAIATGDLDGAREDLAGARAKLEAGIAYSQDLIHKIDIMETFDRQLRDLRSWAGGPKEPT